jgi:hypothetical protein
MKQIKPVIIFILLFVPIVFAQKNPYPNELKGFQFFGKGKLKHLKLGISAKKDVMTIFGKDCESYCDYDKNWEINFIYFRNITKVTTINDIKTKYVPNPKYLGTLYSITLRPKLAVSFGKIGFSSKFSYGSGGSAGHDGKGGGTNISFTTRKDKFGLKYVIFKEITLTTLTTKPSERKGDLISIEYSLPEKLEEEMFIEQK